jgi:hypothetical protein
MIDTMHTASSRHAEAYVWPSPTRTEDICEMKRIDNSHYPDRRRVFVTDIFDKVVKGIGTSVDAVGSKTKELWDLTRIRSRISDLKADKRRLFEELGETAYEMLVKSAFNFEKLNAKAAEIARIDKEIAEAEKELEKVRDTGTAEEKKPEEAAPGEPADAPEVSVTPEEASEEVVEEEPEEAPLDAPKCECGTSIVPGARYCVSCGRPVSSGCKCE